MPTGGATSHPSLAKARDKLVLPAERSQKHLRLKPRTRLTNSRHASGHPGTAHNWLFVGLSLSSSMGMSFIGADVFLDVAATVPAAVTAAAAGMLPADDASPQS